MRPSSVETTLATVPAYKWPTDEESIGSCGSPVAIPPILDVEFSRQRSRPTTNHRPLDPIQPTQCSHSNSQSEASKAPPFGQHPR